MLLDSGKARRLVLLDSKTFMKSLKKVSGQMAVEHQMFFGFIFSNIFLKRNFSFSQDLSSASKNVFIAALKKFMLLVL